MSKLALVAIVRDEEAWLPETIRSARKLGIDSYVIADTGSVDSTRQVALDALSGIPGEWHEIPYESIAQARSEVLRRAYRKAEWLLMLDADMTITGTLPKERTADCYHATIEGSWEYVLPVLVRGDKRWSYQGVAHSYLACEEGDGNYSEETSELRIIDRRPGGWRPGKLEEDARLLEAELERNPSDARSSFYLAQTYDNLGRAGDAIREYGRRAMLGGWDEERFAAKLRRARLLCDRHVTEGLGALLETWHERPTRAEPLYSAARYCRHQGWNEAALLFARQAASIPKPPDRLFVEDSLYSTWIRMELGIAETRAGDREQGMKILRELRQEKLSEANKAWIDEILAETVTSYYDGFRERLLADYEHGNKRVLKALDFAKASLKGAKSILDVGCGIGWSSHEMASLGAQVTGIDISPRLIETARSMWGEECSFEVADFARWEPPSEFDAVLMIDVYEHFPAEERPRVHEHIRSPRLVLTVPTEQAQQQAREQDIPLQPIDESVSEEDIERLASDIGGKVAINRLVSVWEPDDYRHVLIEAA